MKLFFTDPCVYEHWGQFPGVVDILSIEPGFDSFFAVALFERIQLWLGCVAVSGLLGRGNQLLPLLGAKRLV